MSKHPITTSTISLAILCAIAVAGCGRSPAGRNLSATEEAPKPSVAVSDSAVVRAVNSSDSILAQRIRFGFDDASLTPKAKATLAAKIPLLRASSAVRLRLEGHADERELETHNRELGMRRALAAKRYLVQKGIDPKRLYVISYGSRQPLDRGHTETARSRNRRVEFGVMTAPIGSRR